MQDNVTAQKLYKKAMEKLGDTKKSQVRVVWYQTACRATSAGAAHARTTRCRKAAHKCQYGMFVRRLT